MTSFASYCPGNKARSFPHQGEAILLRHESGEEFTGFKEAAAFFGVSHTSIANYARGRRPSRVGKLTIVGHVKKFSAAGKIGVKDQHGGTSNV